MESLIKDIKYALRMLAKRPGFAVLAVVTLALGIGANSAIFSVVNGVLLRPLPYQEPDKLIWIWDTQPQLETAPSSLADFLDWREQSTSFDGLAGYEDGRMFFDGGDTPGDVPMGLVTSDFFSVFRVNPILGTTFSEEQSRPGKFRVVILSYGLWQQRFGADPNIVGQTMSLSAVPYTIIGVMPEGFDYPNKSEFWRPFPIDPAQVSRGAHFLQVVARLKPGVTLDQAQAEMSLIAARLSDQYKEVNAGHGVKLQLLQEVIVGSTRTILVVLLGAVGFVLLIACANVANLMLARSISRQKEFAIRAALGAHRARIIRQLLTESGLLAITGGALGLALGRLGVKALTSLSLNNIPRSAEITLDLCVIGFTFAISLLTGIIFGLAPALQVSKVDLSESLKESGRSSTSSKGRNRLRSLLVISEVALTIVPLIGAGLMIKSFIRLVDVNPGFSTDNRLTIGVTAFRAKYPGEQDVAALYQRLTERLAGTSGVEAVGAINDIPLSGGDTTDSFTIEGRPRVRKEEEPSTAYCVVMPDYFKAMGIPFLRGRDFLSTDTKQSPNVVIISQSLADLHFPGEDPLGHRITLQGQVRDPLVIVGIVGDIRQIGLDEKVRPTIYVPYLQDPLGSEVSRAMALVVHTKSDPTQMAATLRSEVLAVDNSLPIYSLKTVSDYLSDSLSRRRFNMTLLAVFAAVALVLAGVGIYGVVSYSVTERTHEIGIRQALGARRTDIMKIVVGKGMTLVLIGVIVGLIASYLLTRFIESLLYEVSAVDPVTFVVIPLVALGVALLACAVPARRAMRVDPMEALRYE